MEDKKKTTDAAEEKTDAVIEELTEEVKKRKKQRLPCDLFDLECNQYQRFITYCLAHEKDFSEYDTVFHVAGIAHQKETDANAKLYYEINCACI